MENITAYHGSACIHCCMDDHVVHVENGKIGVSELKFKLITPNGASWEMGEISLWHVKMIIFRDLNFCSCQETKLQKPI